MTVLSVIKHTAHFDLVHIALLIAASHPWLYYNCLVTWSVHLTNTTCYYNYYYYYYIDTDQYLIFKYFILDFYSS